jgi:RNA polymerase sigma-70 factor, ECF subfamily
MAGDDAELMVRYCNGDTGAFRVLYARLAPRLHAYLTRMAGNRPAADDLLQQTFLKVHRARGAYVIGADPVPWIYAIAHRTFLDHARSLRRSKVAPAREEGGVPEVRSDITGRPAEAAGDSAAGDPATIRLVLAALEELPPNQRQALVLTKLEGRSIAEAAVIAGSTPGAIKLRAHRAYVALRRVLLASAAAVEEPS